MECLNNRKEVKCMKKLKKTCKTVVCGVLSVALLASYSSVSEKYSNNSDINLNPQDSFS